MKDIYHRQHCAADLEFQKSLTELEDILQVNATEETIIMEVLDCQTSDQHRSGNTDNIDLAALEDAVADIDQYLEEIHKKHGR
ncbi:MAG: hypothetical protein EAZ76_00795 [Nostocales cyanobacterium]|nr:MAG: hypothetical protein EAZ87_09475 [Nostocales cyanobacterium]TAF21075.1 MAG: hypothetical protein EAZ76_00795 [Nostocales cyanobacterium]